MAARRRLPTRSATFAGFEAARSIRASVVRRGGSPFTPRRAGASGFPGGRSSSSDTLPTHRNRGVLHGRRLADRTPRSPRIRGRAAFSGRLQSRALGPTARAASWPGDFMCRGGHRRASAMCRVRSDRSRVDRAAGVEADHRRVEQLADINQPDGADQRRGSERDNGRDESQIDGLCCGHDVRA